jgi:hypothetical protein
MTLGVRNTDAARIYQRCGFEILNEREDPEYTQKVMLLGDESTC